MAGFGLEIMLSSLFPFYIILYIIDIYVFFFLQKHNISIPITKAKIIIIFILISPMIYLTILQVTDLIQIKIAPIIPISSDIAVKQINDCQIKEINIEPLQNKIWLGEHNIDQPRTRFTDYSNSDTLIETIKSASQRCGKIIIENNSLLDIVNDYKSSNNRVYRRGNLILEADPATFVALDQIYSKDAKHVYLYEDIIQNADPNSFVLLTSEYAKDYAHVYFMGKVIPNIDKNTFVTLGNYAKDAVHVYYREHLIADADPKTFVSIDDFYGKDTNYVYYSSQILPDADPGTFIYVGNIDTLRYFKDTKNVFLNGYKVNNANPAICSSQNLSGCRGY